MAARYIGYIGPGACFWVRLMKQAQDMWMANGHIDIMVYIYKSNEYNEYNQLIMRCLEEL